nr:hypothetical transcript [Hymenolepis microstoma]
MYGHPDHSSSAYNLVARQLYNLSWSSNIDELRDLFAFFGLGPSPLCSTNGPAAIIRSVTRSSPSVCV